MGNNLKDTGATLIDDTQDNQARILFRWIDSDVRKVEVERDDCPPFVLTSFRDGGIFLPAQPFPYTVSASCPRLRKTSAISSGRFSSTLKRITQLLARTE